MASLAVQILTLEVKPFIVLVCMKYLPTYFSSFMFLFSVLSIWNWFLCSVRLELGVSHIRLQLFKEYKAAVSCSSFFSKRVQSSGPLLFSNRDEICLSYFLLAVWPETLSVTKHTAGEYDHDDWMLPLDRTEIAVIGWSHIV